MDPHRYNRLIFLVRQSPFTVADVISLRETLRFSLLSLRLLLLYEAFGLLVRIGFDITAFTPSAYQRGSLPRPSMEISS